MRNGLMYSGLICFTIAIVGLVIGFVDAETLPYRNAWAWITLGSTFAGAVLFGIRGHVRN